MAMADLAQAGSDHARASQTVPLSVIAERQRLSVAYLEQIFIKLRRASLVESERGRSGGYKLARPACEIMVADIMTAVEEDTRMTRCHGEHSAGCVGDQRCLTHGLWDALGGHIKQFLDSVSLADVLKGDVTAPDFTVASSAARRPPHGIAAGGVTE